MVEILPLRRKEPVAIASPPVSTPEGSGSDESPASEVPRPPVPLALKVWLGGVATLTGLALFFALFGYGLSALQEQRSQHVLYAQLRGLLSPSSEQAPPIGGAIKPDTPIAVLNAADAGIHNQVVVEGTSSGDLLDGPGHLRDSALPGQAGQAILLGRSSLAGAPFGGLKRLVAGDPISVQTGQGTFEFKVIDERIAGETRPQLPATGGLLTLVTSTGSGLLGGIAPDDVLYVDAALVGHPVAAPAGRPVAVPASELPGRGDSTAWPFLILWLIALLTAAVGAVYAWVRWGRWQTWLLGIPVLFGLLYGTADTTLRLLPNIL